MPMNPQMRPSFSVVIPTRNRLDFARRAVDCALAQEGVDVEIILVDDGSTDGSREQLAALEGPLVRVLDGDGRGPCAARNRALPLVRAPWLAFLDDDDLWAPNKLRELAALTETGGFGFTSAIVVDQHGRPMRLDAAPAADGLQRRLLERNAIGTPSVVIARTDLVVGLGGFDERLPVLGDWELWLRLAREAPAFALDQPLAAYTVHWGSISLTRAGNLEDELQYLVAKHEKWFRTSGVKVDMDWFTQWNAVKLLRRGRRRAAVGSFLRHAGRSGSVRSLLRGGRLVVGERLVSRVRPPAPPPGAPAWLEAYFPAVAHD